jgi:hypothetical protein
MYRVRRRPFTHRPGLARSGLLLLPGAVVPSEQLFIADSPLEESRFEPLVPGTWTTRSRLFLSPGSHSHSCLRDQLVHREGPTVRIRFPPPGEYACAVNPGVIFVPLALCEQSIATVSGAQRGVAQMPTSLAAA